MTAARRKKSVITEQAPALPLDFSCPDWEQRLIAGKSLIPDGVRARLHKVRAERAVDKFNQLRLSDVPGTPYLADAAGEWFRDIVRVVFGSYDPATKSRLLRQLFVLVPKKNMKTTGGALLMLLLLIFNRRPRAQMIMTAPVRDVAHIAFDAVAGAVALDKDLAKLLHVREHVKSVINRETGAELSIMTFDPNVLTGQKLCAALIDELHVVAKNPKAPSALRQIRGGMLPYAEALLIFITTQSEEAPTGIFKNELDTARDIRDGKRKGGTMLPILYEFPEHMQKSTDREWMDQANWSMINPNLGKSITIERLVESYNDEAVGKGEVALRGWASQHLNIEIGVALRSSAWAGAYIWEQNQDERGETLEALLAACEVVEVGIDGGGLDDLLSASVVGRVTGSRDTLINGKKSNGIWLGWTMSWAHKILLERNKDAEPDLRRFERLGELKIVESIGTDIQELVSIVDRCEKAGLLDRVGLDPHGVGGIVDSLLASGLAEDRLLGISQGWRLGGAIKTLERSLAEGQFKHGNQQIMQWAVGNAKVEPRGNAILITKQASGSGKIDPLMATFNAVHLIASNPESKSKRYQMMILGGNSRGSGIQA